MEKGTGAHSQEAWDEEHPRARGPHGLFGAFGLYEEGELVFCEQGPDTQNVSCATPEIFEGV
jgi:hypothetical protein